MHGGRERLVLMMELRNVVHLYTFPGNKDKSSERLPKFRLYEKGCSVKNNLSSIRTRRCFLDTIGTGKGKVGTSGPYMGTVLNLWLDLALVKLDSRRDQILIWSSTGNGSFFN